VGLSGRAWKARDLVFVEDLAEMTECARAPAARRAGVKSGVCLPIVVSGQVVGTMDFFASRTRNLLSATSVASHGKRLTDEADHEVAGLGESSADIGKVVKTIRGIADQTNLLALDATIEAARAGEAGRGFAVVAHEVKELAAETARATTDVDTKVSAIQAQVDRVVAALAGISTVVESITETQTAISGVLAEQSAVTRAILDQRRSLDIRRSASGFPPVWQVGQYCSEVSAKLTSRTVSPQTGQGRPVRACTCRPERFSPFIVAARCPTWRSSASMRVARTAS